MHTFTLKDPRKQKCAYLFRDSLQNLMIEKKRVVACQINDKRCRMEFQDDVEKKDKIESELEELLLH
jgi:hypothetical protein